MKRRPLGQSILLYAVVIFWCFIVLFPFYWLGTTSVNRQLEVLRQPRYIPYYDFEPTTERWAYLPNMRRDTTGVHSSDSLMPASAASGYTSLIAMTAG